MKSRVRFFTLLACIALVSALPAGAQVFFSHDVPGIGLPGTAVDAAPDEGDIFATTGTVMCGPLWAMDTNSVLYDNLAHLGLVAGDNIDAYSVHNFVDYIDWPFWRFSVDTGSVGVAGTDVPVEMPFNAADIFWTDGSGINLLCLWEWQLGLDGDDNLDGLEELDALQAVFFSLTPGSPTLGTIGATAGDILAVVPGSGSLPGIAFPYASIGLLASDDVDGLTVSRIAGYIDEVIHFSVASGSTGAAGSAVAASAPLNGAHIFYSPLDFSNYMLLTAPMVGLLDNDELDALSPGPDGTGPPPKPVTIDCRYLITPPTGIVPFVTTHEVGLDNLYPFQTRRVAAHIDLTIASGAFYPNWQSGFTNIPASSSFLTTFNITIPALPPVIGTNTFQLIAEDVTPVPYNNPPYPPSGDTCTTTQTVVASF